MSQKFSVGSSQRRSMSSQNNGSGLLPHPTKRSGDSRAIVDRIFMDWGSVKVVVNVKDVLNMSEGVCSLSLLIGE